jgi:hypothetical protein
MGVCRALVYGAALAMLLAGAVPAAAAATASAPPSEPAMADSAGGSGGGAGTAARAAALATARAVRTQAWEGREQAAQVESLHALAEHRLQEIAQLPDSLRERALNDAIEDLGGAIEDLGQELSQLDLRIEDQAISLRDRSGGRIRINIPSDLGEQISRGITSITASILDELPDTLRVPLPPGSTPPEWEGRVRTRPPAILFTPRAEPERRIVAGNAVKIFGDIVVDEDEEIAGDAIVVLGDVVVRGQVDGDVVAVLGGVDLGAGSEVRRGVTVVLGRLDRHAEAEVGGNVFTLDPGWPGRRTGGASWPGWLLLGAVWASFLILVLLLLLVLAVFPASRQQIAASAFALRPGACLGLGLLWLLPGQLLLVLLMGVLVLTIIGIPLALLVGLASLGLVLLGAGLTARGLAGRLRGSPADAGRPTLGGALLGFTLLCVPGLLGGVLAPLPGLAPVALVLLAVSGLLLFAAAALGLGALLRTRLGRSTWPQESGVPPPPPGFAS